ncbi:MAG: sporulation protein YunB [Ruminococcaceae bacterium]|nr:sporulation protein YunB [Oscillospiraceae bacterium]
MSGGDGMSRWLRKLCFFAFFLAVICVLLLILFRTKFHGTIRSLAETQIKNTTSDLINDAIDRQIDKGDIQYDRIVYFEKDLNGKITALKTNMSEVNRLKTSILNIINDEILAMDTTDLGIPLGSLFFPEFLSGRGPQIPVQILSISNSDAAFESYFTEAGINQTLQKLTMNVSVDVAILVLGRTENFTVTSQVVVAETIIVGQVPDTLLQGGGFYGSKTEN